MPKHLFVACFFYIVSRGAMAALAPLYESGIARFISPFLMGLFIAVTVLFMRRRPWTWRYMQWIAVSEIALNAIFFPGPQFHAAYATVARLLIATVMVSSCVILWSLNRSRSTKAWFSPS